MSFAQTHTDDIFDEIILKISSRGETSQNILAQAHCSTTAPSMPTYKNKVNSAL